MKESEAWLAVAKKIDGPQRDLSGEGFLCVALHGCVYDSGLRMDMRDRIRAAMNVGYDDATSVTAYPDGGTPAGTCENRKARVLAALLFAEIARDEERSA